MMRSCMRAAVVALSFPLFALSPVTAAEAGEKAGEFDRLLETGQMAKAGAIAAAAEPERIRHYLESRIRFYSGDYDDAGRSLTTALASGSDVPLWRQLILYYRALSGLVREHREFRSEHFVFRAAGADTLLSRYALSCLEETYRTMGALLGCYPPSPVLVEVFPDKESFSFASTLNGDILEKSGTVGICKFNRIMILSPRALPLGYPWQDTLAHEYIHFVVNRLSDGRCPLWLHEGIARYLEKRWRGDGIPYLSDDAVNHLGEAVRANKLISFQRMHPSLVYLKDRSEITLAFAEVSSAVHFLEDRFGAGSIGRLLNALAAKKEDAAFRDITGLSVRAFERAWAKQCAGESFETAAGVLSERPQFADRSEDEFIGADQRGLVRLGDRMRTIGRADAALIHYEKALAAEPVNPVILVKAARAHLMFGETGKARERLELAIKHNPYYVTPYQMLGELLSRGGDIENAVDVYSQALAINPFHPGTHRLLSRCYLALGRIEEAQYELRSTLLLSPDDAETKVLLERLRQ